MRLTRAEYPAASWWLEQEGNADAKAFSKKAMVIYYCKGQHGADHPCPDAILLWLYFYNFKLTRLRFPIERRPCALEFLLNSDRKVKAYCISLKWSDRRPLFSSRAAEFRVRFEFFDAISTDDLKNGFMLERCRIDVTDLRWTLHEKHDPRRQSGPLMFAEIACAYSHIACWQKAKAENLDFLFMFEDDAIICRTFQSIQVPQGADIVYISNRMPRNDHGHAIGYGSGAEGYILTRSGIDKCLEIFETLYMPVDVQMMAHQRFQHAAGHKITPYRRMMPDERYLNAYVTAEAYCRHPFNGESQIS